MINKYFYESLKIFHNLTFCDYILFIILVNNYLIMYKGFVLNIIINNNDKIDIQMPDIQNKHSGPL